MILPDNIEACHIIILELIQQVNTLTALAEKQAIIIKNQGAKIKELEARLNQNSQNSSKPPSSDFNKPAKKTRSALPKELKKQGGQKGHKGSTLKMVDSQDADNVIPLKPERCKCGKRLKRQPMVSHSRRQLFDIPKPKLIITEYQQYSCSCPECGKTNYGVYPDQIKAPVQYGVGIKSLTTLLSVKFHLSHQSISELFVDLYKQPINSATIQSNIQTASKHSDETLEHIKSELLKLANIHLDETGLRVKNKKYWLHVASNEMWTYLYAHKNRGRKAIEEEFLEIYNYVGTVTHDSWETYWSLKKANHSLCGAHILRELVALIEQDRKWASKMLNLLIKLYKKNKGGKQIDRRSSEWRQYKQICKAALEEEPPPVKGARGKPKSTKGRNLAKRLLKYQEEVLRFSREVDIPFTNNQAERDLRPAKGKIKVAGSFRSVQGAQYYARLQSVFSTWRKHGYNVFEELKTMINDGKPAFLLNPT